MPPTMLLTQALPETPAALNGAANLLLVLALGAFALYWRVWAPREEVSLPGALIKTGSTGFLALAGLIQGAPSYAVLGLALGALGDFFMARRGERAFLAAMGAFALGHLVYAGGFLARSLDIAPPGIGAGQGLALAALAALVLSTERWLAPHTGALRLPVRGYVLVIATMGTAAITLAPHPQNLATLVIGLGAFLFLLSDLLLAIHLFRARTAPARRALSLAVWPAYWVGQALILVGAATYAQP